MKKALIALVVVLVVGAGGFWYFVLRDTAPAKLSLKRTDSGVSSGPAVNLDGTWTVVGSGETTAGYRIDEQFVGGVAKHTAVGRTSKVTGTFQVAGTSVPQADFTVDLTAVEFSDNPPVNVAGRTNALKRAGLETDKFPTSSLKVTKPISFGSVPEAGKVVKVPVSADLTLHGVTKPVTFSVDARRNGDTLEVASSQPVPVKLADYAMTPPKFGPVADVANEGSFEFKLIFTKSG